MDLLRGERVRAKILIEDLKKETCLENKKVFREIGVGTE